VSLRWLCQLVLICHVRSFVDVPIAAANPRSDLLVGMRRSGVKWHDARSRVQAAMKGVG
jgi:hypothetical protein